MLAKVSLIRYALNAGFFVFPVSGFFALKRKLCRMSGIEADAGSQINGHTWFYGRGKVTIGEKTWIGPRCRFYTDASVTISIGENCDIAPEVAFVVGSHELGNEGRRAGKGYCKPIVIEDGCWLGARVTVLGGVTIGKGSMIGAGSLVTKDIPANSLAVGVPAKVKKFLN